MIDRFLNSDMLHTKYCKNKSVALNKHLYFIAELVHFTARNSWNTKSYPDRGRGNDHVKVGQTWRTLFHHCAAGNWVLALVIILGMGFWSNFNNTITISISFYTNKHKLRKIQAGQKLSKWRIKHEHYIHIITDLTFTSFFAHHRNCLVL